MILARNQKNKYFPVWGGRGGGRKYIFCNFKKFKFCRGMGVHVPTPRSAHFDVFLWSLFLCQVQWHESSKCIMLLTNICIKNGKNFTFHYIECCIWLKKSSQFPTRIKIFDFDTINSVYIFPLTSFEERRLSAILSLIRHKINIIMHERWSWYFQNRT